MYYHYIAIELYKMKCIISHTVLLLLLLLLDISSTSTSDTTANPTSTDTQQLQSSASLDSSSSLPDSSTLFEPIKTDPSDRKCLYFWKRHYSVINLYLKKFLVWNVGSGLVQYYQSDKHSFNASKFWSKLACLNNSDWVFCFLSAGSPQRTFRNVWP